MGLATLNRSILRAAFRTRLNGLEARCCSTVLASPTKFSGYLQTKSFASLKTEKADISSHGFELFHTPQNDQLKPLDTFSRRHFGPDPESVKVMLKTLGYDNLESFVKAAVPEQVLVQRPLKIEPKNGFTESELLTHLKSIASKNKILKSYIGKGYVGTIVPPVILRNVLECPEWYTSYTPYQPEISQGRLEALLNFQTVISDLTGLPIANASLLDEGSAAAEAMIMSFHQGKKKKKQYYVDSNIHPQTLAVVKSRASVLEIEVIVTDLTNSATIGKIDGTKLCGALVQYPATDGSISDFTSISEFVHSNSGVFAVASDLLALTLLKPPSEFNADIVLGSSQRFGVPMGYGGPHAAFFAVTQKLSRKMPGRLIGLSQDKAGNPALRLALQTREQHIKRDRATSNICTAQALLANMAGLYAVYHGPEGLKKIAKQVFNFTSILAASVGVQYEVLNKTWFDTLNIKLKSGSSDELLTTAVEKYGINLFKVDESTVGITLDETVTESDLKSLIDLFGGDSNSVSSSDLSSYQIKPEFQRDGAILSHAVFNSHHNETAMLRYLHTLQRRDLSLADSMIPLGSCTMKLNATVEMIPITWPEFANIHPFAPRNQTEGYTELITAFEKDLADITGFDATSLMPNSGAQGEYTGLRTIRAYFEANGESNRNVCLIPVSAHGTNPASAAMAGLTVVPVKCLSNGSLDLEDLESKAKKHADNLACMMVTYPSTYGLFEPGIRKAIEVIHENGGQVYLDGANMNAQVGLTSPGDLGADVCHLNLHKTFCIPHGGGGPGIGPICVKSHLQAYLPGHPVSKVDSVEGGILPVSSAPYGSASILPISYSYVKLMGSENLPYASILAILNANYMMERLKDHYPVLFVGDELKHCAHEFIIDIRPFKTVGIEAIDIAKRLQDYSFHAPTMSWPVPNTLMIEPTESEDIGELDRFINTMIQIRKEISEIEENMESNPDVKINNVLKNAPHTLLDIITTSEEEWSKRGYDRTKAAYPLPGLKERKFWPYVSRIDDTYGDLNLFCTCPSVESFSDEKI